VTTFADRLFTDIALDVDDQARLITLHRVLAPQFPAIADAFYAVAQGQAGTAAMPLGPEQVARLRSTLIAWMSSGLLGPYDDTFCANRSRIGHRHVENGLAQHHVIAGVNAIRRAYRDVIVDTYPHPEAHAVGRAVDKLLDLELALLLHDYQHDPEDRSEDMIVAAERRRRVEQVEALRTLCAGLAHEVRNPVNAAKLQLELATRRLRRGGDPRVAEPIALAGHEIDRLTILLDEFLAFARPPALDPQAWDLAAMMRDIIDNHRALAEQRAVQLTLVADHEPIIAEVDTAKIKQVVDNLVCNALQAVTAGGHVSVAVVAVDGHVHLRVTDDGPGIPADVLPRIYEPFFSTKEGGTGMGLSIVHSLVAQHHGTIDVASSPAGTTFDVGVPRTTATFRAP
jgi:signal transduction histidine kinase